MNGLKNRVERLQEQLNPTQPEMLCIVMRSILPVQADAIQPPHYYVGRYGAALFMGGTEKERRREARRLRKSGEYDIPLGCLQAAIGEGDSAETTPEEPASGKTAAG